MKSVELDDITRINDEGLCTDKHVDLLLGEVRRLRKLTEVLTRERHEDQRNMADLSGVLETLISQNAWDDPHLRNQVTSAWHKVSKNL